MKISIVTAVYNNYSTIRDALDSALAQRGTKVELVVIDGGSNDGTLDILREYSDRLGVLVSEHDHGVYDALNKGIARASGEVIGFLHSDDVFADEQSLARVAEVFSDPQVDAVYGDLVYVHKGNISKVIRYWQSGEFSHKRLGWGWMPPHPTFYVRRSVYERLGGFDTSLRIAADYDCMVRFFRSGINVAYIPETLVRMRIGGESNRSLKNIVRKSAEDYQVLQRHGVGGIRSLMLKNLRKVPQFFRR